MIEKAIHITSLRNLKYFHNEAYERIYWGVEFCQNLIPNLTNTEKILRFVKQNDLGFSLVTPFVTEQGLKRLKKIFSWLKKQNVKSEIVVNDWGVLECLHNGFGKPRTFKKEQGKYFELALGRLLVRQQRDPGMKKILEKQSPFAIRGKDKKIRIIVHKIPDRGYQKGMMASYVNSPSLQSLLSRFGIKRVELNNLIQGLNLEGIKFKKSIYTPFVNISTSRFCPMESRFQKIYRINVCKKECQSYYDILRSRAVPKIIYRRGNTTFYRNPLDISKVSNMDIDRIVFQPELPF